MTKMLNFAYFLKWIKKHLSIPSIDDKNNNYSSLLSLLETLKTGLSTYGIVQITVEYKFLSM